MKIRSPLTALLLMAPVGTLVFAIKTQPAVAGCNPFGCSQSSVAECNPFVVLTRQWEKNVHPSDVRHHHNHLNSNNLHNNNLHNNLLFLLVIHLTPIHPIPIPIQMLAETLKQFSNV
jgi:hypothetical protein